MTVKKLSEYYQPEPFHAFENSTSVKLADLVPATINVTKVARIVFGEDISFGFLTDTNTEFITSSMKLTEIAKSIIDSEDAIVDEVASKDNVLVYELPNAIQMRIEKLTTAGGRTFYSVTDE